MRLKYTASGLIQENSQFTVWGPLIWYESAHVRLWIILNININDFHHMGMSQICTGADHYFRLSKPHSEKLWPIMVRWQHRFAVFMWEIMTRDSSRANRDLPPQYQVSFPWYKLVSATPCTVTRPTRDTRGTLQRKCYIVTPVTPPLPFWSHSHYNSPQHLNGIFEC